MRQGHNPFVGPDMDSLKRLFGKGVLIDPDDREQVERLCEAFMGPSFAGDVTGMTNALRSLMPPPPTPRCTAALNLKGVHIGCDIAAGHALAHGNTEHGAIWQGPTS